MSDGRFCVLEAASPQESAIPETWSSIRVPWVIMLWTLFLLSLGLLCFGIASGAAILYTAATLVLFALPGFFVAPIFFGSDPGVRPESAVIGSVFGIAISSYIAIVIGFLYGWQPKFIALAIMGLACVCAAVRYSVKDRLYLPVRKWTRIDYSILAAMGLVLALFTASPALHVGKLTSHGYAYTWLYGFDFVYRSDVIQAMTTKLPPDWFWMTGVPLRMYLVGYAMPAFAYAASGKAIALHSVLLLMTLCSSLLMLACLYIFLRTLFSETKVLLSAIFVTLFAYSYYWFYDVLNAFLIRLGHGFHFSGSVSSVSHHFQRTFLVEPQAALATSLLLIVLSLLALVRYRLNDYALAVFLGICLGVSFGMEAMQGLLAIAWFGFFYLGRLLLAKGSLRDEYGPFLAAVSSCGLVCASFFLLGMYHRSTSHLAPMEFNTWIAKFGLAYFPIEIGPLLLLGAWGVARWWRRSRQDFGWPLLLLGALTLIQVLLVFQKPPARMADRILPVVLVPFVAYFFQDLWSRNSKRSTRLFVVAIILAAVPNFFTDVYFTSDVNNVSDTYYVRPEDMQACQWIRQNLPETAVIQGDYNYFAGPDRGLYMSLIASFAGRPQVLGWSTNAGFVVDNGAALAKERRQDIDAALSSSQLSPLIGFVQKYSVDYLYVGPSEQGKYPQLLPLLQTAPDQFREIYSRNGVSLFRYVAAANLH